MKHRVRPTDTETEHLTKLANDSVFIGVREKARGMVDRLDMVHYDSPVAQRDVIDVATEEHAAPAVIR